MPVPKRKRKLYSKIVGHLQNLGFTNKTAKKKADKAVRHESLRLIFEEILEGKDLK